MDKKSFKFFSISIVGGIFGGFLALSTNLNLLGLVGFSSGVEKNEESLRPSPTPKTNSSDIWEKIVFESSFGSVGIQVFKDGKILNQGSGLAISSDGLIVSVADLFVIDGVYQIFYEDKIFRGNVITKDFKSNLILIKTDSQFKNVADLDYVTGYQSGKEIVAVGKMVNLAESLVFSQKGVISYATDAKVVLDLLTNNYLKGSSVFDKDNNFLGIVFVRNGRANLVKGSVVNSFVDDSIDKNSK